MHPSGRTVSLGRGLPAAHYVGGSATWTYRSARVYIACSDSCVRRSVGNEGLSNSRRLTPGAEECPGSGPDLTSVTGGRATRHGVHDTVHGTCSGREHGCSELVRPSGTMC